MVPSGYDPASPSSLGSEFEAAIAGFEEEWLAGLAPRIEDYLPSGASPPGLLRELIVAEMEFRRKAGADPRVEEYITRFEQLGANRQAFESTLVEIFRPELQIVSRQLNIWIASS